MAAIAVLSVVMPGAVANAESGMEMSADFEILSVSTPFESYEQCERVRAANDLDPHIYAPGPCFQAQIGGNWYYYWWNE